MNNDFVGCMSHPDGRKVTVVTCPQTSLGDTPIEIFPTADPMSIIAAVSEEVLLAILQLDDTEAALQRLSKIIGILAENTPQSDLSWLYEPLDN
jgi:hypothetical protein